MRHTAVGGKTSPSVATAGTIDAVTNYVSYAKDFSAMQTFSADSPQGVSVEQQTVAKPKIACHLTRMLESLNHEIRWCIFRCTSVRQCT